MRKLAEDSDNMSLYIDSENIITFNDCTDNDSYNVFDMFYNAIKDGFHIEFYSDCSDCCGMNIPIIEISKSRFYKKFRIFNLPNRKNVILAIYNFIESSIDEINKKIDNL